MPFRATLALAALAIAAFVLPQSPAQARSGKGKKRISIVLDGLPERVNWNDGDSFRVLKGPRKGEKARLVGYNTLESHGPVHFWGEFHGWELYRTHKAATELAKSKEWVCESSGEADGYGRILVICPELREALIKSGLAHVYAYNAEPDPALVALQLEAQNNRKGMWRKGIPRAIVTSVHSIDEKASDGSVRTDSYNRMCDTRTGKTFVVKHASTFRTCDVFCNQGSCMLYIPFEFRYGDKKAACLKGDQGEKNRLRPATHLTEPHPMH
ncbi:MAG: micrococcal nuclease [Myxococcota bacterium]|jgi:micrococcal nuclease